MEPVLEQQWHAMVRDLALPIDARAPFAVFAALVTLADRIDTLEQRHALVLTLQLEGALASLDRLIRPRLAALLAQARVDELIAKAERQVANLAAASGDLIARGRALDDMARRVQLAASQRGVADALAAEVARLQQTVAGEAAWQGQGEQLLAQRDALRQQLDGGGSAAVIVDIQLQAQSLIRLRRDQLEALPGETREALEQADRLESAYAAAAAQAEQARHRLADFHTRYPDAERRIAAAHQHAAADAQVARDLPGTADVIARLAIVERTLNEIDDALKLALTGASERQKLSRLGFDGRPAG
jgi:hypothetical protein